MTIGIINANNLLEKIFDASCRIETYFCELIGIASESSYNDTLALFSHKLNNSSKGIIFSETIPKPNDVTLINSILQELTRMRIGHFVNEDINLVSSQEINQKIRMALDEVIALAIQSEHFANDTIRNNFIAKLMIWCNLYVDDLDFSQDTPPKCLFYGPLKRHEVYFLLILAYIGLDVVYFNPTNDNTLKSMNLTSRYESIILGNVSPVMVPLEERIQKGVVVEKVTTYAKKATNELEQNLYSDTGIYKPWQFAKGTTKPIIMDSVIEDTLTYWNEPSKLRPGFKTEGQIVYTPVFFSKINGVYHDINAYYELVDKLRHAKNCVFYETPHLTSTALGQSRSIQYHNVPTSTTTQNLSNFNQQDLYSLAFCLNPDQTIKRDAIREHKLYQRFLSLRSELQEFILSKLEETFSNNHLSFFKFNVTDKERIRLMAATFTLDEKLLNLIDSYDFTSDVPKLIMYVNSREPFNQDDAMLIGLFKTIGIDILLLSPNSANNLELVISDKFINAIQLDEFVHDLPLKAPAKKGSFFSRLFR